MRLQAVWRGSVPGVHTSEFRGKALLMASAASIILATAASRAPHSSLQFGGAFPNPIPGPDTHTEALGIAYIRVAPNRPLLLDVNSNLKCKNQQKQLEHQQNTLR